MVMFTRFAVAAATFAAMFAAVAADLTILSPGAPDLWWGHRQFPKRPRLELSLYAYHQLIGNSNPAILVAPLAIIGIEMTYKCSREITQDMANQAVGTGYTILFANPFNQIDIYATSQPFEIKPLGAAYPSTSTEGRLTGVHPATSSTAIESSFSSTSTSAAHAATTTKPSSASSTKTSIGFGLAAVAAVLGLVVP